MSDFLLEAVHITKRFGDFAANDDVTLRLRAGEIHALLGENGAGKSTLVKMMYGALQPSDGELRWRGEPVRIANPAAARALGIGMVFQHFSLFEALTVAENIALALPGDTKMKGLSARIERVSREYGLPLEPGALVADLSVGQRQRIEIVRCLLQEPSLLIMDEPTAVLTPQEADQLFVTLRRLASEGCAILYISHRLEEVKALCHEATVLRLGKVVATVDPKQETAGSLARHMVGVDVAAVSTRAASPGGESRHILGRAGVLAGGEIVAIAGVAGNGQSELFDAVSGERLEDLKGTITIAGHACAARGIKARRALGAAFVPEERLGHGAVPDFPLSQNVILTRFAVDDGMVRRGLVNLGLAGAVAGRVSGAFDVRTSRNDPEARSLSGGNLQKFVIGRELDRKPRLLVVNQPTWGVDAGAAAVIRQALIDLARDGSAVLVISQDLDEIFAIADRIAVISRGQLSAPAPTATLNREAIGLLMAGAHESAPPEPGSPERAAS